MLREKIVGAPFYRPTLRVKEIVKVLPFAHQAAHKKQKELLKIFAKMNDEKCV